MAQLADIMEELGCTSAYNLDGGGSSLAYYNGEMIRVVEDEETQRSLFGIICVGEIR
jgi:exopolysaccharide biosynthesis protein